MPYGIGAGGLLGVALEVLPPPGNFVGAPTAGGALTAGTYKYYITSINLVGESNVSAEVTVTTSAGNLTAHLTWTAVTGATGYKIYRTAAGGASNSELLLVTLGLVTSYDDVAVGSPSGAFPTANTAYNPGVYVAPTKFIPFNDESLEMIEDTVFRRPIRQNAAVIGAVAGNEHPEGDLNMEALEDCILYFLLAARATCTKSGSSPNFTYAFVGNAAAVPTRTISLTIIRSDQIFGYTGCTVGSFKFGINNGMLTFGVSIKGRSEATQSLPVATWPTTAPFGAGQYDIQIPTSTSVTDTDTFEWSVEDNAENQFRLKNTSRGSDFVKFGERDTTITMGRDFLTRADYDLFKAVTAQSITLIASKGVNNSITMVTAVSIKESYAVGLSGQGDLVRANISYRGMIDGSGNDYTLTVKSQENIPV